jgi:uncharacterized protein (TIGR02453 family)
MKQILEFLSELQHNNNREWFDANRKRYEEARDKMLGYTEVLVNEIRKFDDEIPLINPKECLFRIFRDVRFSNDKSPYKTNMGSFIAKGGRKTIRAGYYFHIQPGESFIGGGIYMPAAEPLKAIRQAVFDDPETYLQIVNEKNFRNIFTDFYGDPLKSAPKGFPKDSPYTSLVLPRSYAYGHQIDDSVVSGGDFIQYTVDAFRVLSGFNRFLNDGIDKFL